MKNPANMRWSAAVLVVGVVALAMASRSPALPDLPEQPAAAPAGAACTAPQPQVADAPAAAAAPTSPAPGKPAAPLVATYPDGTTMPLLNGVQEPVQMPWPPSRPFAAIVDKVVDGGQEWYLHADGTWSTTVRKFDTAAHIERTMGQVWVPGSPKPARLKT